ncbi:MAG: hypothetical protein HKP37_03550 [Boseongicola sp.]|nr:hypothetical protein [Boseongicola sp.]NNL17797.1 hypothetical protein [Boseongicola sp.]
MARTLVHALTLDDAYGWLVFKSVAGLRLSDRENVGLAYSSLTALSREFAEISVEAAFDRFSKDDLAPFIDTPQGLQVLINWREARDRRRAR